MDMEENDGQYATVLPPPPLPLPSSSSSSFGSFPGTSRDENSSSLMLTATSTTAAASCQYHHPEVSSKILPMYLSPTGASGGGAGIDVPNLEYSICHQENLAHLGLGMGQARCKRRSGGHGATAASAACAFRPYSRCLGPKKLRPEGTAGGQRAIKTVMSVLSKMHAARLAQYYQIMEMAASHSRSPPAAVVNDCDNNSQLQLKHVLSERKRREKLNDSFKALRAVLPPGRKDKASVLIRAKDYLNALLARITELEEKSKTLAEARQLHCSDGEKDDEAADDETEVDIGRSAAAEGAPDQCRELHLKIVIGSSSGCSAMDAVAGILQGLNDMRDCGTRQIEHAVSTSTPAMALEKGTFGYEAITTGPSPTGDDAMTSTDEEPGELELSAMKMTRSTMMDMWLELDAEDAVCHME
ncbi:hypothetical protein ABZP36_030536 [Zizania latifolia]